MVAIPTTFQQFNTRINPSTNVGHFNPSQISTKTAPYPNDGFTLTSEPKEKSNKMLWALGGLAVLGILAHKFIPPRLVQSRAQKIFLEKFTQKEAQILQKKYSDILKIEDKDKFLDCLFRELKKDYKLNNIPIKLDKTYKFKKGEAKAFFARSYDSVLKVSVDKSFSNKDLLKQLSHELRHAKQDLYVYMTSKDKKELRNVFEAKIRSILPPEKVKKMTSQEITQLALDNIIKMENYYSKIGIKRIDSSVSNWEWGRKMLEGYKESSGWENSLRRYSNLIYEKDAFEAEALMNRFAKGSLFF